MQEPVKALLAQGLVFVFLVGILLFMIRSMRPLRGAGSAGAHRFKYLARYRSADEVLGWVAPLMAMLAFTEIANVNATPFSVGTGVACGVVGAGLPASWRAGFNLLLSGIGAMASLVIVSRYLDGTGCGPADDWVRVFSLIVIACVFAVGALIGLLVNKLRWVSSLGLSAFGVIEIVLFIASPLGTGLTSEGWLVQAGVSLAAGLLGGLLPGFFLSLVGPALALVVAIEGGLVGTMCKAPGDHQGAGMLVAFALAYAAVAAVRRRFF